MAFLTFFLNLFLFWLLSGEISALMQSCFRGHGFGSAPAGVRTLQGSGCQQEGCCCPERWQPPSHSCSLGHEGRSQCLCCWHDLHCPVGNGIHLLCEIPSSHHTHSPPKKASLSFLATPQWREGKSPPAEWICCWHKLGRERKTMTVLEMPAWVGCELWFVGKWKSLPVGTTQSAFPSALSTMYVFNNNLNIRYANINTLPTFNPSYLQPL